MATQHAFAYDIWMEDEITLFSFGIKYFTRSAIIYTNALLVNHT
jgi:hypothetical protein